MWRAWSPEASSCYLIQQKGIRTEQMGGSWQAWQAMSHLKIAKDDLEQPWILAFGLKYNVRET